MPKPSGPRIKPRLSGLPVDVAEWLVAVPEAVGGVPPPQADMTPASTNPALITFNERIESRKPSPQSKSGSDGEQMQSSAGWFDEDLMSGLRTWRVERVAGLDLG